MMIVCRTLVFLICVSPTRTADDPTRERSFRQPSTVGMERQKLLRNMRKKLQQIEGLQALRADGHVLDVQQVAKLTHKGLVERILAALESDAPMSVIEPLVEELRGGGEAESKGSSAKKDARRRKQKSTSPTAAKEDASVDEAVGAAAEQGAGAAEEGPAGPAPAAQPQPTPVKQPPADWDSLVPLSPKEPLPSPRQPRGAKTKRGALSLSLGGAAAPPNPVASPTPAPAAKAPAWGRPGPPAPSANPSLKAILAQQAAEQPAPAGSKPADKPPRPGQSGVALSLGELIDAKVERRAVAQPIAARKQGPAWGCQGGSPPGPGPSFADIQVGGCVCWIWCVFTCHLWHHCMSASTGTAGATAHRRSAKLGFVAHHPPHLARPPQGDQAGATTGRRVCAAGHVAGRQGTYWHAPHEPVVCAAPAGGGAAQDHSERAGAGGASWSACMGTRAVACVMNHRCRRAPLRSPF